MAKKVLVVDDESNIVDILRFNLQREGYEVLAAYDGQEGLDKARSEGPDLILLDVMLPLMDGFQVCEELRKTDRLTPIIMLTAREEERDRVMGLELGADDYVVKPFSLDELAARVAAHLRREQRRACRGEVRFDADLVIDYAQRTVLFRGEPVAFAKKEFDIIEFLSQNSGQVFDRERIYDRVWGMESDGDSAVVAEHIRRIRAKLAACGAEPYIETVWGCGYKWRR